MSNRINPYQTSHLSLYQRVASQDAVRTPAGEAARRPEVSSPAPAQPSADARGLTATEQQAIDRYFPASEKMTLRVYGADRQSQAINPGALGTRLDISG